jgi:uncharacterized protein YegP (UPF0339 family)
MNKKAEFEIRESVREQEYFVLKAPNGKIILLSEEYKSRQSLIKGINSVRKNVNREGAFNKFIGEDSLYYFSLRAKNNKAIGTSEGYTTKFSRWIGIKSVKKNAKRAEVVER